MSEPLEADRVTIWQQGVAGGNVAETPDADHPIRVVGFVWDQEDGVEIGDEYGRKVRTINEPLWITPAFAKALTQRYAGVDAHDRLMAGSTVTTWANMYELEELDG